MSDLVESWLADERLQEHRPLLSSRAIPAKDWSSSYDIGVDLGEVFLGEDTNKKIATILSAGVKPHVDDSFPEWTALWILRSGGHSLCIADSRPKYAEDNIRRPPKRVTITVPLEVGHIVLFNAHRTHWMDRSADGSLMVAAAYDFASRPEREDVEDRIYVDLSVLAGNDTLAAVE